MNNDLTGNIMTWIGLILLIIYVEFMEKKSGKPKHSRLIKFVLSVVFLLVSLDYAYGLF
ncbi:hypothetical protein [Guptibacillus hwajinpoensis]|nr:hypothetical protein [Alkalihalobacillus macyae]